MSCPFRVKLSVERKIQRMRIVQRNRNPSQIGLTLRILLFKIRVPSSWVGLMLKMFFLKLRVPPGHIWQSSRRRIHSQKQVDQSAKEETKLPTSIWRFQISYLFLKQQWVPLRQRQSPFWDSGTVWSQLSGHSINQSLLLKTNEYIEDDLPGGTTEWKSQATWRLEKNEGNPKSWEAAL